MDIYSMISAIVILTISYIVWKYTSQYLDRKDRAHAIRCFGLATLLLLAAQAVTGECMFSLANGWALWLYLSYLIIPILYYKANRYVHNMDNDVPYVVIDSRRDIMIPLYMLAFCSLLQFVLGWYLPGEIYVSILVLVNFLLQILPVIYVMHYRLYGDVLSEGAIISVQQTRWQEAREYAYAIFGIKGIVFFLCALMMHTYIYIWYFGNIYGKGQGYVLPHPLITLVILGGMAVIFYKEYTKGRILIAWKRVKERLETERLYAQEHDKRYAALQVDTQNALIANAPGTVILVIGESASRDYMHVYDSSLPYANTPWLEEKLNDENFTIFNNGYASYNLTMEVLKMALTESSQYNKIDFSESISIIDIVKKAGYKTYWFSHKGRLGQENVATTMIANTTDEYRGPSQNGEIGYDKDFLELLKNVSPQDNNFIVLHLMGSHAYYEARYPLGEGRWNGGTVEETYANTILYTDELLKEVFEYARDNLDLQCMFYFSDHGENLQHGHHPSIRTADTLRIPMFIYLSDRYRELYKERADILKRNKNRFYSNDMVYNTIVGLLGIDSKHYEAKEDLSSSQYNYDKEQILTFDGTMYITEFE